MGKVTAHRAKRPNAKGVLCDTLFLVSHRGRGKSLSVWVRLGSANRSQVGHDVLFPTAHGGER